MSLRCAVDELEQIPRGRQRPNSVGIERQIWGMIRRLASLAIILFAQIAATTPPPIIAAHVKDGAIDLVDLSWLKGALPDATPTEKADWMPVDKWLSDCAAENAARVRAELATLGITSATIETGPGGDLLCGAVSRMRWVARDYADWPSLKTAAAEADRLFVTFSYGVGVGSASMPFDPAWVNAQALELLHATVREQSYRRALAWRQPGNGAPVGDAAWRILQVRLMLAFAVEDHKNTAMITAYVTGKGWPTIPKVGAEASDAAWLLVQHADDDPAFQLRMLRLMEPLAAKGEVSKANYALLFDRVTLKLTGKQRYGTQATCKGAKRIALPIEDAAKVDALRAAMGLDTMAANFARLDTLYGPCPPERVGPLLPKE